MGPWDFMGGMGGFRKDESGYPDFGNISNTLNSISPDPNQSFSAVMDARGENPGAIPHPLLAGKPASEMALYDRYGSAMQARENLGLPMAMLGTLPIAGYEAVKGISQNVPGMGSLLSIIGGMTGDPKAAENYAMNSSTSPASLRNVGAYMRGLFDPRFSR